MKKIKILLLILLAGGFYACDNFLDETPDNRTEIDSRVKIRKLLVSAYPQSEHITIAELSSDNTMDYGETNPNTTRFLEEAALWKDITEISNESPQSLWASCYKAIANANLALEKIAELKDLNLDAEKGEALITRAYSHFVLVNTFCKHYNTQTSNVDLGIPYMEKPETTLNPKYERGNVADVYKKIESDITAALPLIKDNIYEVGSYHFTQKAANAFAARFYLYYGKWAEAKKYADIVLTSNPLPLLRDWSKMGALPNKQETKTNEYINSPAALLLYTANSGAGTIWGPYGFGARYNHLRYIADLETVFSRMPWTPLKVTNKDYRNKMWVARSNNFDKVLSLKLPYLFEIVDAVQQIGYRKTVVVPFTTDELLLVRAEAEAMLGENDLAMADLNIWSKNFYNNKETTLEEINNFYNGIAYDNAENYTMKKKLNPKFALAAGVQENLIQYILQCRRVLTLHEGLRWFDVKRYGIEIYRKQRQGENVVVIDVLKADDNRKAIQLPQDVITAGLQANPR